MKIGLVCPYDIFKGGGVQECVLALRSGLEKRGHFVRIITPLPRKQANAQLEGVDFVGTSTDLKSPFHTTAQVSVNLNPDAIDNLLEKYAFDILHFHEPWVPIAARQILARSNACNIATFHAKLPETVMAKTIERVITPFTSSIIRYIDGFTAVSPAAAEYAETLTDQPIEIIPNGISTALYKGDYEPSKRGKRILYVGRLERRKGVKYLLDAFTRLVAEDPGYQLEIAGDGADAKKLQKLVADSEIPGVLFHGQVSDKQKRLLMNRARVFCSPALYGESFGIVLLEAMSMGLPIVAGNNPGYRAVLDDLGDISLVNPKDTEALYRRIKLLASDEGLAGQLSAWGQGKVRQYDYEQIIDMYEKFYNKVCLSSKAAGAAK